MGIIGNLRNMWRTFRSSGGQPNRRHVGHSLADAVRDSTQASGSQGHGMAGTDAQHRAAAEGHESYKKSFEGE